MFETTNQEWIFMAQLILVLFFSHISRKLGSFSENLGDPQYQWPPHEKVTTNNLPIFGHFPMCHA
jgi:hypothetical protein